MFNIRAQHMERDLADVHAAFGDAISGLRFDFADRRTGSIQAIGGRLGRSGISISSHQVTACSATLPAGGQLKYERARRGKIVQLYGETNLVSSAGSSFLTGPGKSQMRFQEDAGPIESMSVNLPVDTLAGYLAMAEEPLSRNPEFVVLDAAGAAQDQPLMGLLEYLVKNQSFYAENPRPAELADSLLLETYISFLRTIGYLERRNPPGIRRYARRRDGNAQLVARAEEYIRVHYSEALIIPEVAGAVGVSTRKLQKAFKEQRGMSPKEYLAKVRLEQANLLLSEPAIATPNVTEIAFACGISHLGRFSQAYLRVFGEHPSITLARSMRKS